MSKKQEKMSDYFKKNSEGYSDPTSYQAIKNIEAENEKFHKFMKTLNSFCELSGFSIDNRIVVRDVKTGRTWR